MKIWPVKLIQAPNPVASAAVRSKGGGGGWSAFVDLLLFCEPPSPILFKVFDSTTPRSLKSTPEQRGSNVQ